MKITHDWIGLATLVALVVGAIVAGVLGQEMLAAALGGAAVGNLTPAALRRSSRSRTRAADAPAASPDDVPTNPGGGT